MWFFYLNEMVPQIFLNANLEELEKIDSEQHEVHIYNVAYFTFLRDIVVNLTNKLCNNTIQPSSSVKRKRTTLGH